MTKKTKKQAKVQAAYHLWLETPNGNTRYAGVAYRHKKGTGLNILIGGVQYLAFEPKEHPAEEEGA